jgi:hypothetical protein
MTKQALDGSPDAIIRHLSFFLLIPVGSNRQGFAEKYFLTGRRRLILIASRLNNHVRHAPGLAGKPYVDCDESSALHHVVRRFNFWIGLGICRRVRVELISKDHHINADRSLHEYAEETGRRS